MIIVSDTSPISNLLKIDRISLLKELYGSIVIPESVFQELMRDDFFKVKSGELNDWLLVKPISNEELCAELHKDLDIGEAEAITLAHELYPSLLLVDERKGRTKAISLGINVTGIVGVLLTAKDLGLIAAIKPELDKLEHNAGFWLSAAFRRYVIELANET